MATISNVFSEMGRLIEQVSKDRGIEKQIVVNAIISGLLSAARKKFGTYRDIEVKFNEEAGKLELYEFKEVVADDKFVDDQIEIKLSEALKMDSDAQIGDQIGLALDPEVLGRIDAHAARQVVAQSLQSAENEVVFNEFEKRKGEIVSGVVRRVERGMIVVDMERTEAYIPRREQIYGEKYNPGDRIQGYILEVRQTTRGPQIIMSRAHSNYLIKLFEKEVPEIYEGIVKIVSAAREPGQRAKIAVYSNDSAVHPVGSCVGMKGSRVQNITQELKGERIDVIVWEDEPVQFVCNALAPAKISKVLVDEENKEMEVIVPDDQLSLAIGKRGQNVQLAVNLTGWRLNIVSLVDFEDKKRQAIFNLKLLPDVAESILENIYQCGISSVQDLASSSLDTIMNIPSYELQEQAEKLIQKAKDLVAEYKKEGKEFPKAPELQKKSKIPIGDVKAQADQQLKEELAQLSESDKESAASGTATAATDSQLSDGQTETTKEVASTQEETKEPVSEDKEELAQLSESDKESAASGTATAATDSQLSDGQTETTKEVASTQEETKEPVSEDKEELAQLSESDKESAASGTATAATDSQLSDGQTETTKEVASTQEETEEPVSEDKEEIDNTNVTKEEQSEEQKSEG